MDPALIILLLLIPHQIYETRVSKCEYGRTSSFLLPTTLTKYSLPGFHLGISGGGGGGGGVQRKSTVYMFHAVFFSKKCLERKLGVGGGSFPCAAPPP